MPRAQKKILKNAKALKVISTSVPPETYKVLKTLVTDEYTMSHVLRDLIQKSDLMRGRPANHSHDLEKSVASLQEEIAQLRKEMQALSLSTLLATEPDTAPKTEQRVAEAKAQATQTALQRPIRTYAPDYDFDDLELDEWCQNIIQEVIDEDLPMESSDERDREKAEYVSVDTENEPVEEMPKEPVKEKNRHGKSLLGHLTAMLGVARKTA